MQTCRTDVYNNNPGVPDQDWNVFKKGCELCCDVTGRKPCFKPTPIDIPCQLECAAAASGAVAKCSLATETVVAAAKCGQALQPVHDKCKQCPDTFCLSPDSAAVLQSCRVDEIYNCDQPGCEDFRKVCDLCGGISGRGGDGEEVKLLAD